MKPTPADVLSMHLNWGYDGRKTEAQLAEELGSGWTHRMVMECVRELRMRGRPVCSNGRGVWLSDSSKEMADQAQRLRERALHQLLTARAVRATARRMAVAEAKVEQISLWSAA